MADDLGWGDLGCYGSEAIETPNIDSLADDGVRLTQFFSCSPVCSPSRAGLLTGRYPKRSGVNFVYVPTQLFPLAVADYTYYNMPWGLPTEEITMAEAVKQEGYSTCCVGKWHLGDLQKHRPYNRGFDHFFGVLHSNDAFPLKLFRNNEVVEKAPVNQELLTRNYTNEATNWIKKNSSGPFMLYFAHTFPHIPLHASDEFIGKSRGGLYGDTVEELDWSVGQVLKALDDAGVADNTFVFFTSDNGPWFEGSSGAFRGRKGQTLDGGMRVPGIGRWQGHIPAGTTSDQMSMNIDLFTTALTIAGANVPQDRPIDGKNIIPLLKGEQSPHEALYFYHYKDLEAVRTPKWKYHRKHKGWAHLKSVLPQRPVLIDLETDPTESYNVIDKYPEIAKKMEGMMQKWEKEI
jgi:arylsulfatase A